MSQVSTTVTAYDLGAFHAKRAVRVSSDGSRHRVEVRRPAATGLELVRGVVQWGIAAGAGICALGRLVLVVFAGECAFCALFAKDTELFLQFSVSCCMRYQNRLAKVKVVVVLIPGLRIARH